MEQFWVIFGIICLWLVVWFGVLWRQFQCLTVSAIKLMRSDQPVQPANRPSLSVLRGGPAIKHDRNRCFDWPLWFLCTPSPSLGSDWSVRVRTWHLCSKQPKPSSSQVWMGSVSSPVQHNGCEQTAYQPLPTISLPALPAAKPVLTFLPLRCPVRTRHTMSDSNERRKGHGCWCPASKIKWN